VSIAVFYIDPKTRAPGVELFEDTEMTLQLAACKRLREAGMLHVCPSTDFADKVGQDGVSDVLPEGYDWTMRRHVGPVGRPSGTDVTGKAADISGRKG
jgi:hypothetical protein